MKVYGIITNASKDVNFTVTSKITDFMISSGVKPMLLDIVAKSLNRYDLAAKYTEIIKESDVLVVLGGDGTILGVAQKAAVSDKPLLGINLGTLGFLTDVEQSEAIVAIKKVIAGDYKIERRMMLEASLRSEKAEQKKLLALNDICVTREVRLIDLLVYVNGEYVDQYRADGLIVATPTGSTAYNLSAGGPLLTPNSSMISITAICPHNLHARSIVVSANDTIDVVVGENNHRHAVVSTDGQHSLNLKPADVISIKKSEYFTSIIKTNDTSFFDVLRNKIM